VNHKVVYAVVVTYKRKNLLEQVLNGLLAQTYYLTKIIIVDNNSQDGTQELIEKIIAERHSQDCEIEYHNTMANLGGAGGFEYGFKAADADDREYDYLWLMDDDLLPAQECLEILVSSAGIGAEIVQPLRINLDGSCAELSPVVYNLSAPWLINPKRESVMQKMLKEQPTEPFEIAGIPFEGPLISRSVIKEIGYPNPAFFIFNDDLDFALRARKSGAKIICQPNAVATRLLLNNQGNDLKSWKGYFMLRNHFYILRQHGENFLVKLRPIAMVATFCFLYLFKGDFKLVKTCFRAFIDSKNLSNNDIYKP